MSCGRGDAGGPKSVIGAEPMELEEGDSCFSSDYHYFGGHIGTETDVQTTPHSVFSRGKQVRFYAWENTRGACVVCCP